MKILCDKQLKTQRSSLPNNLPKYFTPAVAEGWFGPYILPEHPTAPLSFSFFSFFHSLRCYVTL